MTSIHGPIDSRAEHMQPRAIEAAELERQGLTVKQIARRMQVTYATATWLLGAVHRQRRAMGPVQVALTPAANARIDAEIAAGVRCACGLLKPCEDHSPNEQGSTP